LDEKGLSCLNKAKGNAAVVHQLIKSGADASSGNNPFILDAIESMDLMTVKLLASLGAAFNRKPPAEEEEENEDDSNDAKAMGKAWPKVLKY
jgi:hypothetical protein